MQPVSYTVFSTSVLCSVYAPLAHNNDHNFVTKSKWWNKFFLLTVFFLRIYSLSRLSYVCVYVLYFSNSLSLVQVTARREENFQLLPLNDTKVTYFAKSLSVWDKFSGTCCWHSPLETIFSLQKLFSIDFLNV